jgi:hypothetical protein
VFQRAIEGIQEEQQLNIDFLRWIGGRLCISRALFFHQPDVGAD